MSGTEQNGSNCCTFSTYKLLFVICSVSCLRTIVIPQSNKVANSLA